MNDLTAVVLNFRTPDKTLACLQSLAAEGIVRIVLVENSQDGGATLAVMRSGLQMLDERGVQVDIVDEGRNLGFATGVNRALARVQARGATPVLLLNSDARLESGALALLKEALNTGADMAAPLIAVPGHETRTPRFYYQKYLAMLTQHPVAGSFSYITGACMLLAADIAKPGLFDEDFFFYGEDVMLGADLAKRGKICVVVKDENSRVVHEGSGSARNGSLFYEYHINRGHWLLAHKLGKGNLGYTWMLVGRALMLTLRAFVRSVRFGSATPLCAYWMATMDVRAGRCRDLMPR